MPYAAAPAARSFTSLPVGGSMPRTPPVDVLRDAANRASPPAACTARKPRRAVPTALNVLLASVAALAAVDSRPDHLPSVPDDWPAAAPTDATAVPARRNSADPAPAARCTVSS